MALSKPKAQTYYSMETEYQPPQGGGGKRRAKRMAAKSAPVRPCVPKSLTVAVVPFRGPASAVSDRTRHSLLRPTDLDSHWVLLVKPRTCAARADLHKWTLIHDTVAPMFVETRARATQFASTVIENWSMAILANMGKTFDSRTTKVNGKHLLMITTGVIEDFPRVYDRIARHVLSRFPHNPLATSSAAFFEDREHVPPTLAMAREFQWVTLQQVRHALTWLPSGDPEKDKAERPRLGLTSLATVFLRELLVKLSSVTAGRPPSHKDDDATVSDDNDDGDFVADNDDDDDDDDDNDAAIEDDHSKAYLSAQLAALLDKSDL